ncbi:sensor histidine kinase [Ureibacillus manganicus]|uniref:histidine kinase n=1 Tax=Ureibacillus manganicus DSM 26584 TaxID=1384049 RepID=A0A0A3I5J3_9BACL|nr:HAMP domain-containing sensor histidine kinase [Ureibacillus manganicus]KGR79994.1 histidine kinase [Ureibacillus manganicus DSM 26584]
MKKLSSKIWSLIILFLVITVVFMSLFTNFLYDQLYVKDSEESMIEVGERLQSNYQGGKVTDEFVEKVEDFNMYSTFNVFAVRNPKELSACVPFEIDYDTLIGPEERRQLLKGEPITKIGYEERFEREVISVIVPLTDQNRLEGIIYLYYPLARITELANNEVIILISSVVVFSMLLAFFVHKGLGHIMRPLNELQHAVEKMSDGDYKTRVNVSSKDEIGKLSEAFNEMAAAIQSEDEDKKTFLATVSHELRTPISYVKGYSEAIQNNFIEGKEKDDAIQLIHREANRMERLTNELLQLAHSNRDQEKIDVYPMVISETIRESVDLLKNQSKHKEVEINLELDDSLIVQANEEKLKQIFINVIENSIRYSNKKSLIYILLKASGGNAVIEINDQGIGIPKDDLPYITEPFYRVNKARSRADGGSGLGLSIVKDLVKQHNGKLLIDSELGKGTYVTITIPLMEEL